MTSSTDPTRDQPHDARPEGHGPGDEADHRHPILEAFNAEEIVESPGAVDEEPSTITDAEIQPPQ